MFGQDSDDDFFDDSDVFCGVVCFLINVSDLELDSDDEVCVKVKSVKDKCFDEFEFLIKQIENGQKNGDWILILVGMLRF